jgi:hypothetical protein
VGPGRGSERWFREPAPWHGRDTVEVGGRGASGNSRGDPERGQGPRGGVPRKEWAHSLQCPG